MWKQDKSEPVLAASLCSPTTHFGSTLSTLSRSTMSVHDVIIIGSGLAALTAARALTAHKPLLLEARNRIGGRAHTCTATDSPVDLGCSMVHGLNEGNPITKLLKDYNLVSSAEAQGDERDS